MSSSKNRKVKTYNPKTRSNNRKMAAAAIIIVIAIAIVAAVTILHETSKNTAINSTPSPTPSSTPSNVIPTVTPLTSPAGEYSSNGTKVLFITSMGDIVIQLRDDKPITSGNFVNLVNTGYYNGTTFPRVIAGFMIQGGQGNYTAPTISDEIGNDNHNLNMTIAMANTGQANSASSQFFINVADNSDLDTGYTVFGTVIYGQSTVMAISNTPVGFSSMYDANVQPVTTVTLIGAVVMPS